MASKPNHVYYVTAEHLGGPLIALNYREVDTDGFLTKIEEFAEYGFTVPADLTEETGERHLGAVEQVLWDAGFAVTGQWTEEAGGEYYSASIEERA